MMATSIMYMNDADQDVPDDDGRHAGQREVGRRPIDPFWAVNGVSSEDNPIGFGQEDPKAQAEIIQNLNNQDLDFGKISSIKKKPGISAPAQNIKLELPFSNSTLNPEPIDTISNPKAKEVFSPTKPTNIHPPITRDQNLMTDDAEQTYPVLKEDKEAETDIQEIDVNICPCWSVK